MGPRKRKIRIPIVLEFELLPAGSIVTTPTILSVLPPMIVVCTMTRNTFFIDFASLGALGKRAPGRLRPMHFRHLTMAAGTRRLRMFSVQGEFRIRGMVEFPLTPRLRVVAFFTAFPEAAPMGIVHEMAALAGQLRLLKFLPGMAERTGHFLMAAIEYELGLIVIKMGTAPSALLMTVRAVFSELAAVRIRLRMTGRTSSRRLTMLLPLFMTTRAIDALMSAFQGIIGRFMFEGLRIQADDIRLPPEMLSMAASALRIAGRGR